MEYILGIAASLLVQWLKRYSNNEWATMGILLCVSVALSGLYLAFVAAGYWQTVAQILLTAGAFYAFIVQRFENPKVQ